MSDKVMLVRNQSFAPYWARMLSFGPMSREEAKDMAASRPGGNVVTMKEWKRGYLAGQYQ